jgi:uncharacterized membrane protein YgcG
VFTKLGPKYIVDGQYSKSEKFIFSLYDKTELRLYEIRQRILKKLDENIESFKSEYVYQDVVNLELCTNKIFLTQKGKDLKKHYTTIINCIDKEIDSLLQNESEFKILLQNLGSNLIFLEKQTLDKLKRNIPLLSELSFLDVSNETFGDSFRFNSLDSFSAFDNFGDNGSSDFDFGGGDFGGGGSGDTW